MHSPFDALSDLPYIGRGWWEQSTAFALSHQRDDGSELHQQSAARKIDRNIGRQAGNRKNEESQGL